ncbi:ribosomal protein L7/L12 [Allomyces macrogynus ATCC 38327]|uniref:Ribosomal protein L7/L12 n=1 Tax=Allomyces macrogynus (strain ATCC 38327) TaxID=578462 RepID=A0A0L0SXV1_ALLM3|nr:ribosomal protein L7/L12 [Allomyces macrogynus ATCC 38327]|eukprot:KNE67388.1 ribosomal protein L7/L12 [Allomyces macrogynus ATCC 38327]
MLRAPLARSLAAAARPTAAVAAARWYSDKPAANSELTAIVDKIAKLTLTETADLIGMLKERLNISEVAVPVAAAPAAAAPAAAPVEEEKPAEKTQFKVKLEKFDTASKAKIIKEIRALMPSMNLVEAKKFVESAPKMIKEDVPKEEAEKMKAALEAAGATVILE